MARYYPGFLGAFFIILLRVAIGWHFLYEGLEKRESTQYGKEPFSAEIYLRNANGPLGPYFRHLLPDVDGRDALDPAKLKDAWRADAEQIADYFGYTDTQRNQVSALVDEADRWADHWFSDPENAEKRKKYLHNLDQLEQTERDPQALSFEQERAWDEKRALEADRRAMVGELNARGKELRDAVAKKALPDQIKLARAPLVSRFGARASTDESDNDPARLAESARSWDRLDWINYSTTYGLIAIGACLMLGLLTPLAALGAAAFLAMIYLSMPPWPGLPPNPKTEGHYLIVSKNLIELIACLVIATTPSGHWIGLDALLFGSRRRQRTAPAPHGPAPAPATEPAPPKDHPAARGESGREPIPIG